MSDYTPHGWAPNAVDPERCLRSVHEQGRSMVVHQCTRKPTAGSKYCTQHTDAPSDGDVTLYRCVDTYGGRHVNYTELAVHTCQARKTAKGYRVVGPRPLTFNCAARFNASDVGTSVHLSAQEAIEYRVGVAARAIQTAQRALKDARVDYSLAFAFQTEYTHKEASQ